MAPRSHREFEIRDIDRSAFEQKEGMSIMEAIDQGIEVSEGLLKEDEMFHQRFVKDQAEKEARFTLEKEFVEVNGEQIEVNDDTIYDSEGRPESDIDGLSIDYDEVEGIRSPRSPTSPSSPSAPKSYSYKRNG